MSRTSRTSGAPDQPTEGELEIMRAVTKACRALKLLTEAASANALDAQPKGLLNRLLRGAEQPGRQLTKMEIALTFEDISEAIELLVSPRMQRFMDEVQNENAA